MWRSAVLLLVLGGCAHKQPAPQYTTDAQARWAGFLAYCAEYASRADRDPEIDAQCRAGTAQAMAEDAAERQHREEERGDRRRARFSAAGQAFANGMAMPSTSVSCTSNTLGSTTYTDCR